MPLGHCCHPDADDTASPCRCCGAGVIVALESRKLPWRRLGIVAVAALVSSRTLPLLRYHRFCHGAGILAALASLPTLPWRCLGIAAVAALASSRMSPWRCCHCCVAALPSSWHWSHRGRCPGAAGASSPLRRILVGDALALLPLLPSQRWHHRGAGIIADVTLAPLGRYGHHGTGVIIDIALALLPTLPLRPWRHRSRCNDAVANVVWAPSPLWRWRCHPCHAGIIAWAVLPLQRGCQSPLLGWGLWGPPQPF
jgi:hypothetical protein